MAQDRGSNAIIKIPHGNLGVGPPITAFEGRQGPRVSFRQ